MPPARLIAIHAFVLASLLTPPAMADAAWQQPPKAVLDVLRAPDPPVAIASPTGESLAVMRPLRYPPIAELARPMLKLAGLRVDPRASAFHQETAYADLAIERVSDGKAVPVALPPEARVTRVTWSADGRRFAFANRTPEALELWIGDGRTAAARRIEGLRINPLLGSEIQWMPDQRNLLVKRVPPDRGAAPEKPAAPIGPRVLDCAGGSASSTYEARDLLTGPFDEALFDYHALSQLVLVDAESGAMTPVGRADILGEVTPSPDGSLLLVDRLHRPWSYTTAWYRFPHAIETWDLEGRVTHVVADLPLADKVPIQGVAEGPRGVTWRQTAPATLTWAEALDGGDPGRKVEHRDRMLMQAAPFEAPPREIHRAAHRIEDSWWGEHGLLIVSEYERERRWRHDWALNVDSKDVAPRQIVDLSVNDRYADPGMPVVERRPDGALVLLQDGDAIYMTGDGGSPAGDRPFLDRFSLKTLTSERLFRSDASGFELFSGFLDAHARSFLTRRESPADPPNWFARTLTGRTEGLAEPGEASWGSTSRALTAYADPTPQIRGISKRIITYQRSDGVPLSFTLYLPPGYHEGTKLPTVVWAYPLEYSDPATAGQVAGSDRTFTRLVGPSQLFFLLDGYAVLNDVTMPVIGDPDTAYDTFVEQLVLSAQSAVDKAVDLGVTDRDRVGIMGHSHGALMTATLLAHSDIFRAGIARSGAYNHTMRPFGFQNERRTLWQAPETYTKLSPVMFAPSINEPLLLIHGEVDQNPGTVPLQSEKLFDAIRGTGGTARLVMLPNESHGYVSREAVEQALAEQLEWFDHYVKNAPPRDAAVAQQ
jgi:dipeptidyl aminopeptidase/acylaminoacyl peptidase